MWANYVMGNYFLQDTFSPVLFDRRPQSASVICDGDFEQHKGRQSRVKDYEQQLLQIKKNQHLSRVKKTKFFRKYARSPKDTPSLSGVSSMGAVSTNKDTTPEPSSGFFPRFKAKAKFSLSKDKSEARDREMKRQQTLQTKIAKKNNIRAF